MAPTPGRGNASPPPLKALNCSDWLRSGRVASVGDTVIDDGRLTIGGSAVIAEAKLNATSSRSELCVRPFFLFTAVLRISEPRDFFLDYDVR